MKINKEFNGEGKEGFLLIYPDISTGVKTGRKTRFGHDIMEYKNTIVVFRIYDENGVFKDYKIRHYDLKIKLLDGHFYETDEGNFIDYKE